MKAEKIIKVCNCDNNTPLIWTFKFPGAEYWCPRCGYISGMFGAGRNVLFTPEREKSLKEWEKKAKPFLLGKVNEWKYTE